MSKKSYAEKLKDPRWQKKRLEVMERDKFKCLRCGDSQRTLNVHHIVYPKSGNPWDASPIDLVTLCEPCHGIADDRDTMRLFRLYMALSGHSTEAMSEAAKLLCTLASQGFQVLDYDDSEADELPVLIPGRIHVGKKAGKALFAEMRSKAAAL